MTESGETSVEGNTGVRTRPAVGFIATENNCDALVRGILRAKNQGYEAIVVHNRESPPESVELVEQLDVHTVQISSLNGNSKSAQIALRATAKALSFPGIILVPSDCPRLNFQASHTKLNSKDFSVSAVVDSESPNSPSVAIGIPAYNEEGSIGDVVNEACQVADTVLVVDDGSSDNTAMIARSGGATVIEHEQNRGYGAAVKTLFREASRRDVTHLAVLDADGQHDPSEVQRLIEIQRESSAAVVIGSRFTDRSNTNIPLYRRFGVNVINALTNLCLGRIRKSSRLTDTQSGFRVYNAEAIETLVDAPGIGDQMDASTDILYYVDKSDLEITEIGTTIDYDVENGSSYNPVYHGMVLLNNLLKTLERDRPVTILGVPGFILLFTGFGFGYWAVTNYLNSGTFPIGLALTTLSLSLIGILVCITGIILHAFNTHIRNL